MSGLVAMHELSINLVLYCNPELPKLWLQVLHHCV